MAPTFSFLISSGSKKKKSVYKCVSEAKASHSTQNVALRFPPQCHISHKWGCYSAPLYICLLKVLCPVSRPITTLDCVPLKDYNRAVVARSGPDINSRACLCVLPEPRHNTKCWLPIQCYIVFLTFCLETPKEGSGPTNRCTEPSLAILSAISFTRP